MAYTPSVGDGIIGLFQVPAPGLNAAVSEALTGMTMGVTEVIDVLDGISTRSNAHVDITGVDLISGEIHSVVLQHKKDTQVDWRTVGTFAVNWTVAGNSNETKIIVPSMEFSRANPITHEFRAYFLNGDGKMVTQNTDGKTIGVPTASGGAGFLEAQADFNGVTDFSEYPAVTGLRALNASSSEGGTYASPASLPDGTIHLAWDDMRTAGDLTNHPAVDGSQLNFSAAQMASIRGYVIFVYLSGGDYADPAYPNAADLNGGTWYKFAEVTQNSVVKPAPRGEKVMFWVGCKISAVPASISAIAEVPYSAY